jgi:hypothetical protein
MDRKDLEIFARMASSNYQNKYIDNATKDEYVVPDELLEGILSTMKRMILYSNNKNRERILNLYVYCIRECDNMPKDGYNTEQWSNIKIAVSNYLSHIEGFSITDWEKCKNV